MGEDALQRFIAELLRPLVAMWVAMCHRRCFVGADQFIYLEEGNNKLRVAPDVYVLPEVAPDVAPPCWKLWELDAPPSFALEIVSRDSDASARLNALPDAVSTPELNIACAEGEPTGATPALPGASPSAAPGSAAWAGARARCTPPIDSASPVRHSLSPVILDATGPEPARGPYALLRQRP